MAHLVGQYGAVLARKSRSTPGNNSCWFPNLSIIQAPSLPFEVNANGVERHVEAEGRGVVVLAQEGLSFRLVFDDEVQGDLGFQAVANPLRLCYRCNPLSQHIGPANVHASQQQELQARTKSQSISYTELN